MATEPLNVPEQHLTEVIKVIRTGLAHTDVREEVREALDDWCDDEERYLREQDGESP
jgi:hypothetical protein